MALSESEKRRVMQMLNQMDTRQREAAIATEGSFRRFLKRCAIYVARAAVAGIMAALLGFWL